MHADQSFRDGPPEAAAPAVVQLIDVDSARRSGGEWERLAAHAREPNPFHARAFVLAHLEQGLLDEGRTGLCVVKEGERWIAMIPFTRGGAVCGWRRIAAACTSPYMPFSLPLVDAAAPEDWADRLLDGIGRDLAGEMMELPKLALGSRAGRDLVAALAARGWPHRVHSPFSRPVALLAGTYDAYARQNFSRNRRRSLARLRRRLEESGCLAQRVASSGDDLAAAFEAFVALEDAGWKGRRGTSLAARPEALAMTRRVLLDGAGELAPRIDLLLLDGKPVAASIAFVMGEAAFMWKIADAEPLRRLAPGIVLEDAILRNAHRGGAIRLLDSCTDETSPLSGLYGARLQMGDLVFAVPPAPLAGPLFAAESLRRRSRGALASLAQRLRRG